MPASPERQLEEKQFVGIVLSNSPNVEDLAFRRVRYSLTVFTWSESIWGDNIQSKKYIYLATKPPIF